ncbi:MAG: glycosyltransferase family 4 protein [Vicinamibacteria bacterium]
MRVLSWLRMYSKKYGSLEEYCVFLTEELVSRGHTSLFAFPRAPEAPLRDRLDVVGAELLELQVPAGTRPSFDLWRRIRDLDVDVVHGTFLPFLSPLPVILKLAGVPRVIFSDQTSRSRHRPSRARHVGTAAKARLLAPAIDLVIADAEYVRESLITESSFPDARIHTLYNGVNPERFSPDRRAEAFKEELGIASNVGVVASVSQAIPEKGLDVYLRAAREVVRERPDTAFLVVGDGPALPELKELARSLGIEERVIFTGLLPETQDVFAISDVLVLLPRWREAFAFARLETMAAGRPLVASRIGAIPEAVVHGETGLLVPPEDHRATADALLKLLADPAKARRMGAAARHRCERLYDVRTMVKATVDLYEALH